MIKITHNKKKKYKKEYFVKGKKSYGTILETTYQEAFVLFEKQILKVGLSLSNERKKILFVGDKVILNQEKTKIESIIERKNILSRQKVDSTKINTIGLQKIIAVNIDLAVIVVSCSYPPLHANFIDRYAILLQNCQIPYIVCVNKCELKSKQEDDILKSYKDLGMNVLETSTFKGQGIIELKNELKEKQVIFVGNSGVGKSSLLNAIIEKDNALTGNVGEKSKRGCHTTTNSKLYFENTFSIIDTPGIRSLDMRKVNVCDIVSYFQEFKKFASKCKYKDCFHIEEKEENCFIKQAVKQNLIHPNRYASYVKLMKEVRNKNKF